MLALTDETLAKICIGATAIAPARRSAWLRDLAGKLDPPPSAPSPRIAATRRWRRRERDGRILLKIEAEEISLALALVDAGLLTVNQADDRQALNAAVTRLLQAFSNGDVSPHAVRDRVKIGLLTVALAAKEQRKPDVRPSRPRRPAARRRRPSSAAVR